jgi:hypothetical protein
LLAGDPVTQRTALIMPEFFRGESIAPAPTVVLQK